MECRRIFLNERLGGFPSNKICTHKYTWYSWIPKSLIYQFMYAANVYFLIISVLTCFDFSPKSPFAIVYTLGLIILLSMIKEAYEDYFRHKEDNISNSRVTHVIRGGEILSIKTQDLRVGDFVYVKEDEPFPADLCFISSSHSEGLAYVNTMNLDGETNLKEKSCPSLTKNKDLLSLNSFKGALECDLPSKNLVSWDCRFYHESHREIFSMKQLLLRGCVLKNTEFAVGIAVYTGHQTKILMNSANPPGKVSNIMKSMNRVLLWMFLTQGVVCLALAIFSSLWEASHVQYSYLHLSMSLGTFDYIQKIFVFYIAYSHFIPISFYLAVGVVKLLLAVLINKDLDIYYEPEDRPAVCQTSELVEELGQIEYIFSDKTGTLTCNIMEFKACAVNKSIYDITSSANSLECDMFWRAVCICHNAFSTQNGFQGPSPDEIALLEAAQKAKFVFLQRSYKQMKLLVRGQEESYEVLAEIPFMSQRRRMTVIVKNEFSEVYMFTKGADSVMIPLLENPNVPFLEESLHSFSVEGLRTLVFAYRKLESPDYWLMSYNLIESEISGNKEEKMADLFEEVEKEMSLIGGSALEDKLQEGVSETISLLLEAGIKIWVLTGDKQETAEEISRSCNLIKPRIPLINLSSQSPDILHSKLMQQPEANFSVIINGESLAWALSTPELRSLFFNLATRSDSCICCRSSPSQKLEVVRLCKQMQKCMTLAVGDGANDVNMIQGADIGVGIYGKEGTQAVQAADVSIGQFRYLGKLILVHGRWAYRRISLFVCYYFYKNIAIVSCEVCFAWWNGASGQIYILDWMTMLYNAVFTSWACVIACVFEQDLNLQGIYSRPVLYKEKQFSKSKFGVWALLALWHGVFSFWVPVLVLNTQGLWFVSMVSFTIIIHIVAYKLFVECLFITTVNVIAGILSLASYYVVILFLNIDSFANVFQPQMNHLIGNLFSNPTVVLMVVCLPIVALLPDYLIVSYRRMNKVHTSN